MNYFPDIKCIYWWLLDTGQLNLNVRCDAYGQDNFLFLRLPELSDVFMEHCVYVYNTFCRSCKLHCQAMCVSINWWGCHLCSHYLCALDVHRCPQCAYVHSMYTVVPNVHLMYTCVSMYTCVPNENLMYTGVPNVHLMYTCVPNVHLMYTCVPMYTWCMQVYPMNN